VITSSDNAKLKEIRRLRRRAARDRDGRFLAEGEDLLAAADASGWEPVLRLCAAGSGLPGEEVEPELLAAASALGSGTRAAAVYEQRWSAPAGPLCVYLHGLRDPGNVGTIVRSAVAFRAASVVLFDSADPFSPKAVRASMGAVFEVPLARAGPDDLPGELIGLTARAEEGEPLRGPAPAEATLLVGAEREGLPPDVLAACDRVVHIPIATDSLNAGMAATVALYELTRMAAS
jgi:TrmH family RNA methyltransferase